MQTQNNRTSANGRHSCIFLVLAGWLLLSAGSAEASKVGYIYSGRSMESGAFKELLEENGFSVDLIEKEKLAGHNLSPYGLLIADPASGESGYEWGPDEAVSAILESGRPVLGLGAGGARLFQEMDLSINWGNSAVGSASGVYVMDPSHIIFNGPNQIPIPKSRVVELYTQQVGAIVTYRPAVSEGVVFLGRGPLYEEHYTLCQQGQHVLWGYAGGPSVMTGDGKALFINLVVYLSKTLAVLYGVNNSDDSLSVIDWDSGASEVVGPLELDPDINPLPSAMAVRDSDSKIFVWDNAMGLVTVNPQTGRASRVDPNAPPPQGQLHALAFGPDDTLYGMYTNLYRINTSTGALTHIGSLSRYQVVGADVAYGKTLYALTSDRKLLTVSMRTGGVEQVVSLEEDLGTPTSLAFNFVENKLLGSASSKLMGDILFDIDPARGQVSNIRTILDGRAPHGMDLAAPPPPELYLSMNIEDAQEGIPVNKLAGDTDGPADFTYVEVVTRLTSYTSSAKDNISVVLTVPGDAFGAPTNTWVRKYSGSAQTAVSFTNLGGGRYRVTTDLQTVSGLFLMDIGEFSALPGDSASKASLVLAKPIAPITPIKPWWPTYYTRQIVWRFKIPNNMSPQDVHVSAEVGQKCADRYANGRIRILSPGSVDGLIITNRRLMYDNHADSSVEKLLQRAFAEAQGFPASHSPTSVVYYVERYSSKALNWDNTNINYATDATANDVADAIDDLIEDWDHDASSYVEIYIPFIGNWLFRLSYPNYLTIVGDDDIIPFYRYNDPTNDEGINVRSSCPSADGWCVDSATNPTIHATDHDYILTDNPYADWSGGTDWQTGDVEMWAGRILGETAADMLSLLEEGVDRNNGDRGGVVMASVDGWELGLEPDDGRAGELPDLHDVTALLRGKGFDVRNDDVPSSEVRTIDVMSPYDTNWNTAFTNAMNDSDGMDLFFIGGHDSYDHAVIPGDDYSPDDTPTKYTRLGTDHPIVMITGCHGGLPVPDIDVPGGVDDSIVYDAVHEGARAYIGATGFSYGSPNNLHKCRWAERMMQRFFGYLVKPPGVNSMAIGKALAESKRDFVFGISNDDGLDRKTVTEFNLYGVPWAFMFYPSGGGAAGTQFLATGPVDVQPKAIAPAQEIRTFTQTFDVQVASYNVRKVEEGKQSYDLITVPDGDLAIAPGVPVLPFVEAYDMVLPFGGEVRSVEIVNQKSKPIGKYNIPIAVVEPWSEGGISYTTSTDINYAYPRNDNLVQYQTVGGGAKFTVFPVQHNPTTDDTTFYSSFSVKVTYESPLPVAVHDFETNKEQYLPDDAVLTSATIHNVIDQDVTLTASVVLQNIYGEQVSASPLTRSFLVVSGGSYELGIKVVPDVELPDGKYKALLNLYSGKDYVGGASTSFAVVSCEIAKFIVPGRLAVGETGRFFVVFMNHRSAAVDATSKLTIQDNGGSFSEDLPPQPITVPAGSSRTVMFLWMPVAEGSGDFNASARVAVGSMTYGPASENFEVKGCTCLGDLNADSQIDLEDLQAVAGILLEAGSPFVVPVEPGHCGNLNDDEQIDLEDLQALAGILLDAGSPFIVPCE